MPLSRDPAKARAMQQRAAAKAQENRRRKAREAPPKPRARTAPPKKKVKRSDARPAPERRFTRADWYRPRLGACACCSTRPAVHRHHAVLEQAVDRAGGELYDPRNQVPLSHHCHLVRHHGWNPDETLPLTALSDDNFAFALDTLGAGPAYEHLRRHYVGDDPRLDALLEMTRA